MKELVYQKKSLADLGPSFIRRISASRRLRFKQFLGFTMQICSKSEWGSTLTVLTFMLYWREQMIGKHEANTFSEHLIHSRDHVSI